MEQRESAVCVVKSGDLNDLVNAGCGLMFWESKVEWTRGTELITHYILPLMLGLK